MPESSQFLSLSLGFSSGVSNLTSATTFARSVTVLFPSYKARYFVRKKVRCKRLTTVSTFH